MNRAAQAGEAALVGVDGRHGELIRRHTRRHHDGSELTLLAADDVEAPRILEQPAITLAPRFTAFERCFQRSAGPVVNQYVPEPCCGTRAENLAGVDQVV